MKRLLILSFTRDTRKAWLGESLDTPLTERAVVRYREGLEGKLEVTMEWREEYRAKE